MAAMIWDEQAQAFKEADVPMKYDPTADAWTETTGLAYNPDAAAWEEKWGNTNINIISVPLKLYNPGNASCKWDNNNRIYLTQSNAGSSEFVYVVSDDCIDMNKFGKVIVSGEIYTTYAQNAGYNPRLAFWNSEYTSVNNKVYILSDAYLGKRSFSDLEIDVSKITGLCHVGVLTNVYHPGYNFNSGTYIILSKFILTN